MGGVASGGRVLGGGWLWLVSRRAPVMSVSKAPIAVAHSSRPQLTMSRSMASWDICSVKANSPTARSSRISMSNFALKNAAQDSCMRKV